MSGSTLLLYTSSYPYAVGSEQSFVGPELAYLRDQFDRVILIPTTIRGAKTRVPGAIEVEDGLALYDQQRRKGRRIGRAAVSAKLYREIARAPKVLIRPRMLRTAGAYLGWALDIRRWTAWYLAEHGFDLERTLFYTYWTSSAAFGLSMLKTSRKDLKLVSRAHGYDVYDARWPGNRIPFRAETLRALDRLYLISEDGRRYITGQFPWVSDVAEIHRLGVAGPRKLTEPSADGVFRIVSCASVLPVKRVPLLARGIAAAGRKAPDQRFVWHHIGDGPQLPAVERIVSREMPENVEVRLWGRIAPEEVWSFYEETPVDLFINTSESEGLPVSIMEAQSCGIPVVATAVGGNTEVVSGGGGVLLPASPAPAEIGEAILCISSDEQRIAEMRIGSRSNWERHYRADTNYEKFAQSLRSLII